MKVMWGHDALTATRAGTALTIGTFDGVHLGHRALVDRTRKGAATRGLDAGAVTWDRHPLATLRPTGAPPLLTTLERRIELLDEAGLDLLAVLPFDEELSRWSPERFAAEILAQGLAARAVFVGEGWRFGHKAAGDVELLAELGRDLGFEVETVRLQDVGGRHVSSSRVRKAVAEGDMDLTRRLLGRPFDLEGAVVHGDHRGASLGYPTANVEIVPGCAHPPRGVYAGRARARGRWYRAATNLGVNPTFGGAGGPPRLESYLLDFDGDLYGTALRIELWTRLRDEVRFESAEDLVAQISRDVEAARTLDLALDHQA